MQEHSAVLKQFPAVGRRTACGHLCGPCGRGAVRGGCVRVAWGEGSGGRGVGARGSWQGGGMRGRPAPRTSGYRLSPVRRWGWVGGAVGVGSWGRGRPRAPPLWIPAFAGMTGGVGDGEGCWWVGALRQAQGERGCGWRLRRGGGGGWGWGAAPRRAPALGSRLRGNDGGWLRANGFGGRACDGVGGCVVGRRPAPRPSGFLPSQE